jgi:hypothetical protein
MITDILHNTCLPPSPASSGAQIRVDFICKMVMDTTMTLSSKQEFEAAFADSLPEFYSVLCSSLTFAYELDKEKFECTDDVDGHFNVVYLHFKITSFGTQHQEALNSRNSLPTDKVLSVNETTVKIRLLRYETDPSFVAYNEGRRSPKKRHCFHNPYSNTTVLMFPLDCNDDKEFNRVYSTTYLDCPSSLVCLHQLHIARHQHGLHFLKTDNFVPFSNFRTFNSSHVYICQKNLLAMKVASIARKVIIDSKMLSIVLLLLYTLYN